MSCPQRDSWLSSFARGHPLNVSITSIGQPTLRRPGTSWGFGALFKRLTSVVDTSCQSQDSTPQPWVTSGFKSNTLFIRPRLPYPLALSISSLSFSADAREKGRALSNSSARSNCEPHDLIRLHASAAVGPESREADGCPSFLEKRDRRERSFFIEKKAHSTRRFFPQGHRVRALCPNKRRKDCVCHRVSNNEDTDPHTS